ncbi:MAG TPA: prepilin-type N-terminal cleavage/methylation domain-containing protein [Gemmataceae bacterium]|nr:prepilin-type N-terminal cleavage/methylation domain-containing protein [Gemmataceae bacterium]
MRLQIADCRLQIADCKKRWGTRARERASAPWTLPICNLQSATSRKGFTLIEMITVMVMIGFLFSIIAAAILATVKIEKAEAASYQKMVVQHALADQFRADVAAASSAPDQWQDWVKGPDCLILKTNATDHVVYHWHEGKLERIENAGKKLSKQYLPLGDKKLTVEFTDASDPPVTLTLRLKSPPPRPAVEISAALGGDRK